ncbi:MAG: carotenoid oxygenase family protein [Halieaceae bacterium]
MSPNPYLEGNFAPVEEELTSFDLPVTGEIPQELSGRLLRIGPNPVAAEPDNYHWFTGNGMAHGLRLREGRAEWYRSRYVRDDEVVQVKAWDPVAGPVPEFPLGPGVANTNIIGIGDKTFAIVEAGNLPVELDYELETVARSNFDGTLPAGFSAHPHRDPDTGELHTAVYSPLWQHIQYVSVSAEGVVTRSVDVPTPGSPMVHDCMFTANYFILFDFPVVFDVEALNSGAAFPYSWTPDYGARVGLLPRNGSAEDVSWHEVELCYVFHPLNGYEDEQGRVVLDVVRHPRMFATDKLGPNEGTTTLDRWTIDPGQTRIKEERLDDRGQEFPRLDERRAGKSYRYGYSALVGEGFAMGGLLKHDLLKGSSENQDQGKHRIFMEPVFVPRSAGSDEDDGWVMAYLYDSSTDSSDVVILNAQDFSGEPVATIHLPRRVPFGFHGNWVAD